MDTMDGLRSKMAWGLSFLLGHASALLGLALTISWSFAFAYLTLPVMMGWAARPTDVLPIEPPVIGLALGGIGLLIARVGEQPVARYSVAGLALNAVPLVLALVLLALRSA